MRSRNQTADYRRGGNRAAQRPPITVCWLGAFGRMELDDPVPPCDGRLVRCHLIPKGVVEKAGGKVWDRRVWVWGCGGITGIGGHHGMFDSSRTLRLAREALPAGLEEMAYELGLLWFLDRTYGEKAHVAH